MNSYNQTKKIMDDLALKVSSRNATQKKKLFLVVLEGTDLEFEELKRLGAIEIGNLDILSSDPNILPRISPIHSLRKDMNKENNLPFNEKAGPSKYISVESVITEKDVLKLSEEVKELVLKGKGIITPLARDLAKKRGIKVVRG